MILLVIISFAIVYARMLSVEHLEVLAERMPGGKCMSGFKLVGDMCVSIDPGAYQWKQVGRPPCPSGQVEASGACTEPCAAGKRIDGFICTSHDSTPAAPPKTETATSKPAVVPACKIEEFASF